ncbi:MAG: hypothetical protein ACKPJF_09605, partial [Dolichospermum sp.]
STIQIIATTHSPLILTGHVPKFNKKKDKLYTFLTANDSRQVNLKKDVVMMQITALPTSSLALGISKTRVLTK